MHVQIRSLERHVGGPERHFLVLDLLDALARTDRLIVHRDAGLFFVCVGPFRIDRIGEGSAGARNVGSGGGSRGSRDEEADRRNHAKRLQDSLLSISRRKAEPMRPWLRRRGVRLGRALAHNLGGGPRPMPEVAAFPTPPVLWLYDRPVTVG